MKKVKYIITTFCCLIFIVFCSFSVACELKGDLFDKSVLKKCELEFLQKPENVTNEKYYFEGYWETYSAGDDWYEYTCEIESLAEYHNYVNSVLQGFIDNNYTFGYMGEIVYLGDMLTSYRHYLKVYTSLNLEDYGAYDGRQYVFLYTKKPMNKLKEGYGGKFLGHRELLIDIRDEANENGKYEMCMRTYGGNSKSEWGNYIFEKE